MISYSKLIIVQAFLDHICMILPLLLGGELLLPQIRSLCSSFIQQMLTELFGLFILWTPFTSHASGLTLPPA